MIQHAMFFVIWFAKLSLNPWYRRRIHLKHHLLSGQQTDIEERLIGLGYHEIVSLPLVDADPRAILIPGGHQFNDRDQFITRDPLDLDVSFAQFDRIAAWWSECSA